MAVICPGGDVLIYEPWGRVWYNQHSMAFVRLPTNVEHVSDFEYAKTYHPIHMDKLCQAIASITYDQFIPAYDCSENGAFEFAVKLKAAWKLNNWTLI